MTGLSEHALEARKKTLNASTYAAVVGKHPWTSLGDLWAYHVFDVDPSPVTDVMRLGSQMEPSLLDWAESKLGKLWRNQRRVREPARGVKIAATHDALVLNGDTHPGDGPRRGVQAKFVSGRAGYWGDDGSDQVPDYIVIQTLMEAWVSHLDFVHCPVFNSREHALKMYVIDATTVQAKEAQEKLVKAGVDFWVKHVETKIAPPESMPSFEVMKRVVPEPESALFIDNALVNEWLERRQAVKDAEAELEMAKTKIAAALGDIELGFYGDEKMVMKFMMEERKGYVRTVEASRSRVLRNVKCKKEWRAL